MKLANLATAAVFAGFLAGPLGSLAIKGLDPAAEKAVSTAELTSVQLLAPDDKYRNDVARRLVTNSPVGMDAIRARNTLDFKLFGFVNTSVAISGKDGWLFYKPGFYNGACLSDRTIGVALGRIEAMRSLAKAIGIDLRVSVSPDKEVVYPEKLGPPAEAAAGCKLVSAKKWREMAKVKGSSIIDHLAAFGHIESDDLLYFKTDTHWNELGKILSVAQLAKIYLGKELKKPSFSERKIYTFTDITRNILRIRFKEKFNKYEEYIKSEFESLSKERRFSAVIIHDSFYNGAKSLLQTVFLDPTFISFGASDFDARVRSTLAERPPHVLINTVERELYSRVLTREMSWLRGIGIGLLEANAATARECPVAEVTNDALILKNLNRLPTGDLVVKADSQIHIRLPNQGRPCVRISFETTVKQPTLIHLPVLDPVNLNESYIEGFSLMLTDALGPREFWLVLPEDFAGTTLRIDPIGANGSVSKLKIQSGFLPQVGAVSSQQD